MTRNEREKQARQAQAWIDANGGAEQHTIQLVSGIDEKRKADAKAAEEALAKKGRRLKPFKGQGGCHAKSASADESWEDESFKPSGTKSQEALKASLKPYYKQKHAWKNRKQAEAKAKREAARLEREAKRRLREREEEIQRLASMDRYQQNLSEMAHVNRIKRLDVEFKNNNQFAY